MKIKESITVELSRRETAIICIMRRLRFGIIEKLGVNNGEPGVVFLGSQRLDLMKEAELMAVLDATKDQFIDLSPAGLPTTAEQLKAVEQVPPPSQTAPLKKKA